MSNALTGAHTAGDKHLLEEFTYSFVGGAPDIKVGKQGSECREDNPSHRVLAANDRTHRARTCFHDQLAV